MKKLMLLTLTVVMMSGCSNPTEDQRLAKQRASLTYRSYHFASEKAADAAVKEYNKRAPEKVSNSAIHAILSLLWLTVNKEMFSLAEADMVAAQPADNQELKLFAMALESVCLAKMKCPVLAKTKYEQLKKEQIVLSKKDAAQIEVEHKILLLGLICVGVYQDDPDLARIGSDGLAVITQLDYLPPLVGAIAEAKKGSPLRALEQLRELNKNEKFGEHKRAVIQEITIVIENCKDKDKLCDELLTRVVEVLLKGVMKDIFSDENQRALFEKATSLQSLLTGSDENKPKPSGTPASQP